MHGCSVLVTGIGLCPDYHSDSASLLAVPPLAETNADLANRLPGERGLKYASRESLLLLIAANQALQDAQLDLQAVNAERAGIAISTASGGMGPFSAYYATLRERGLRFANPMDSPYLLYNGAPSLLGIRTGFTSFNATFSSGITGLVDAIAFVGAAFADGLADVALVGGVEVGGEWPDRARSALVADDAAMFAEGAVVLVLESADHAAGRRTQPYCRLLAAANCGGDRETGVPAAVAQVLREAGAGPEEVQVVTVAGLGEQEAGRTAAVLRECFAENWQARLGMCHNAAAAGSYALAGMCRMLRAPVPAAENRRRLGIVAASDPTELHGAVLLGNV